ncbi:MAG: cysteine desulfurase [Alphaproteobacteria bacterium RIFOXYD12_FULL_60_8]|nr:MAG: cysteine desulfurase [Alphaproteobacteria bacterium RIFOXYD12_FULL_60_8]
MSRVYLDYNATAPLRPEARHAVIEALALDGNPSSVHAEGRAAREAVEQARDRVAAACGAGLGWEVVFTSGGTEANVWTLTRWGQGRVLVSAVEHPSVLKARPDAEAIPVDSQGVIDLDALERLLRDASDPVLVALMHANNETGVIQPVAEAARIAHAHGALLHCDAVQSFGKIAMNVEALGADSYALSAHKLGGPSGVGALVVREGLDLPPLLVGGGQERGKRAGTENLTGLAGFAAVAALPSPSHLQTLRDHLEAEAKRLAPSVIIPGNMVSRLPNTSLLLLPGVTGRQQVMALDLAGIAVSAGSACASGKVAASHVLAAMGLDAPLAACAVRVSLGWGSTAADAERFLEAWGKLAHKAL